MRCCPHRKLVRSPSYVGLSAAGDGGGAACEQRMAVLVTVVRTVVSVIEGHAGEPVPPRIRRACSRSECARAGRSEPGLAPSEGGCSASF